MQAYEMEGIRCVRSGSPDKIASSGAGKSLLGNGQAGLTNVIVVNRCEKKKYAHQKNRQTGESS